MSSAVPTRHASPPYGPTPPTAARASQGVGGSHVSSSFTPASTGAPSFTQPSHGTTASSISGTDALHYAPNVGVGGLGDVNVALAPAPSQAPTEVPAGVSAGSASVMSSQLGFIYGGSLPATTNSTMHPYATYRGGSIGNSAGLSFRVPAIALGAGPSSFTSQGAFTGSRGPGSLPISSPSPQLMSSINQRMPPSVGPGELSLGAARGLGAEAGAGGVAVTPDIFTLGTNSGHLGGAFPGPHNGSVPSRLKRGASTPLHGPSVPASQATATAAATATLSSGYFGFGVNDNYHSSRVHSAVNIHIGSASESESFNLPGSGTSRRGRQRKPRMMEFGGGATNATPLNSFGDTSTAAVVYASRNKNRTTGASGPTRGARAVAAVNAGDLSNSVILGPGDNKASGERALSPFEDPSSSGVAIHADSAAGGVAPVPPSPLAYTGGVGVLSPARNAHTIEQKLAHQQGQGQGRQYGQGQGIMSPTRLQFSHMTPQPSSPYSTSNRAASASGGHWGSDPGIAAGGVYGYPNAVGGIGSSLKAAADAVAAADDAASTAASVAPPVSPSRGGPVTPTGGSPASAPGGSERTGGKGQKGLRHFSLKVCEAVERLHTTTYNAVADELVASLKATGECTLDSDEKNIRRRVYDALNVLMALGSITKVRKDITWVGLPEGAADLSAGLLRRVSERKATIAKKTELLSAWVVQLVSLKKLIARNKRVEADEATLRMSKAERGGSLMSDAESEAKDATHSGEKIEHDGSAPGAEKIGVSNDSEACTLPTGAVGLKTNIPLLPCPKKLRFPFMVVSLASSGHFPATLTRLLSNTAMPDSQKPVPSITPGAGTVCFSATKDAVCITLADNFIAYDESRFLSTMRLADTRAADLLSSEESPAEGSLAMLAQAAEKMPATSRGMDSLIGDEHKSALSMSSSKFPMYLTPDLIPYFPVSCVLPAGVPDAADRYIARAAADAARALGLAEPETVQGLGRLTIGGSSRTASAVTVQVNEAREEPNPPAIVPQLLMPVVHPISAAAAGEGVGDGQRFMTPHHPQHPRAQLQTHHSHGHAGAAGHAALAQAYAAGGGRSPAVATAYHHNQPLSAAAVAAAAAAGTGGVVTPSNGVANAAEYSSPAMGPISTAGAGAASGRGRGRVTNSGSGAHAHGHGAGLHDAKSPLLTAAASAAAAILPGVAVSMGLLPSSAASQNLGPQALHPQMSQNSHTLLHSQVSSQSGAQGQSSSVHGQTGFANSYTLGSAGSSAGQSHLHPQQHSFLNGIVVAPPAPHLGLPPNPNTNWSRGNSGSTGSNTGIGLGGSFQGRSSAASPVSQSVLSFANPTSAIRSPMAGYTAGQGGVMRSMSVASNATMVVPHPNGGAMRGRGPGSPSVGPGPSPGIISVGGSSGMYLGHAVSASVAAAASAAATASAAAPSSPAHASAGAIASPLGHSGPGAGGDHRLLIPTLASEASSAAAAAAAAGSRQGSPVLRARLAPAGLPSGAHGGFPAPPRSPSAVATEAAAQARLVHVTGQYAATRSTHLPPTAMLGGTSFVTANPLGALPTSQNSMPSMGPSFGVGTNALQSFSGYTGPGAAATTRNPQHMPASSHLLSPLGLATSPGLISPIDTQYTQFSRYAHNTLTPGVPAAARKMQFASSVIPGQGQAQGQGKGQELGHGQAFAHGHASSGVQPSLTPASSTLPSTVGLNSLRPLPSTAPGSTSGPSYGGVAAPDSYLAATPTPGPVSGLQRQTSNGQASCGIASRASASALSRYQTAPTLSGGAFNPLPIGGDAQSSLSASPPARVAASRLLKGKPAIGSFHNAGKGSEK